MRRARRLALALALLAALTARAQFSMAEQFEPLTIVNSLGDKMQARAWRHYGPNDLPVPVVVLLHGSGECGQDNGKQLDPFAGLYKIALVDRELPPALYLIPQCTQANGWVKKFAFEEDYRQPRYPSPALRTVKEYLDRLIKEGTADPDRLYIGGYSLGGFATWDAIQRWPGYFAAAVPVCGGGSIQEEPAKNAAQTPVWAFHGAKDPMVPVVCTQRTVAAVTQAGGAPKYTEYPEANHNIWTRVFGDKALVHWMFRQRRGKPPQEDGGRRKGFFGRLLRYVTPA